jgi:hypothetical protein
MSMKKYAIMFAKDLTGRITEVVGSDKILPLDGRLNPVSAYRLASAHCRKRGFDGYRIWHGDLLTGRYFGTYQNISGSEAEVVSWAEGKE